MIFKALTILRSDSLKGEFLLDPRRVVDMTKIIWIIVLKVFNIWIILTLWNCGKTQKRENHKIQRQTPFYFCHNMIPGFCCEPYAPGLSVMPTAWRQCCPRRTFPSPFPQKSLLEDFLPAALWQSSGQRGKFFHASHFLYLSFFL